MLTKKRVQRSSNPRPSGLLLAKALPWSLLNGNYSHQLQHRGIIQSVIPHGAKQCTPLCIVLQGHKVEAPFLANGKELQVDAVVSIRGYLWLLMGFVNVIDSLRHKKCSPIGSLKARPDRRSISAVYSENIANFGTFPSNLPPQLFFHLVNSTLRSLYISSLSYLE